MQKYLKSRLAIISGVGIAALILGLFGPVDASSPAQETAVVVEHGERSMIPPIGTGGQDPINAFLNCVAGCEATRDAAIDAAYAARDAARQAAHDAYDAAIAASQAQYAADQQQCRDNTSNGEINIFCLRTAVINQRNRNDAATNTLESALQAANSAVITAILAAHADFEACVQGCLDQLEDDLASN